MPVFSNVFKRLQEFCRHYLQGKLTVYGIKSGKRPPPRYTRGSLVRITRKSTTECYYKFIIFILLPGVCRLLH